MTDESTRSIRQSVLGADRAFRVIDGGGGAPPPAPPAGSGDPPCPITALGHRDGMFYFLDVRGQKRALTARQLGARHDILSLFGGHDGWLWENYPKRVNINAKDPKLDPVWKTVDFAINDAAAALQRACFAAGLFGDHIVLRHAGIWRGPDGVPAAHCGDKVLLGDTWHDAGAHSEQQYWVASPPTPRPDTPCPVAIGRELQAGLAQLWRWQEAGGPVAVLGLIGNAYYGAATEWRPAGFFVAETGAGKTALQRVIRACLPLHHFDNDASKAGIEQAIAGRAMPIIIDEAADRANRGAARDLIDLVLSAAGDEGTQGSRGTVDGKGRRIELVGLIMMFSINPPDLEPQHLGRLTLVGLRAPEEGADHREAHAALAAFARRHGRALWGRALAGWDRYCIALEAFRAGLRAKGCAPREMDQAGALLAGWWVLTNEGVPDARGVAQGIAALEGYVRLAKDVAADGRPRRMLQHLLSALVSLHRSTDRDPIGLLLDIALGEDPGLRDPDTAGELLRNYGIRAVRACALRGLSKPLDQACKCVHCVDRRNFPVPRMSDDAGVWLANNHPELRRLFERTPFDGEKWRYEALRLPGARPSGRAVRVGMASGHAVWLPRAEMHRADEPDP